MCVCMCVCHFHSLSLHEPECTYVDVRFSKPTFLLTHTLHICTSFSRFLLYRSLSALTYRHTLTHTDTTPYLPYFWFLWVNNTLNCVRPPRHCYSIINLIKTNLLFKLADWVKYKWDSILSLSHYSILITKP